MTPRDLRNNHTTGNSCRDTLQCATWHKNYLSIFTCWWRSLLVATPSLVSLLSDGTVQPENTYSCILKVTGQVWQCQKRISINTNCSYHQCSSPKTSLNWSNNKIRFSFNQPNVKSEAGQCNKKYLPHNS